VTLAEGKEHVHVHVTDPGTDGLDADVATLGTPLYLDNLQNGTYTLKSFNGPGTYHVRLVIPAGWQQTLPANGGARTFTAATKSFLVTGQDFGLRQGPGWIVGAKQNDVDGDGIQTAADPYVAGVTMYIDLDGDSRLGVGEPSANTDVNGIYVIANVPPGTYTVREVAASGWEPIAPASGSHTVTVASGAISYAYFLNRQGYDFGDAPFQTSLAQNGARHKVLAGFRLGAAADVEADGVPSVAANSDDASRRDDEDGMTFEPQIFSGRQTYVDVTPTFTGFAAGYFHMWADYNQNNSFEESEKVFSGLKLKAGTSRLTFTPAAAY
jgi:hypothetical protein